MSIVLSAYRAALILLQQQEQFGGAYAHICPSSVNTINHKMEPDMKISNKKLLDSLCMNGFEFDEKV